jgi:hypothetical protein
MKKLLIGLGLAAMLSGCASTGLITVFSSDTTLSSNYVERKPDGREVAAICDNKNDTSVTLSFSFVGERTDFQSFQAILFGTTNARPQYSSPVFSINPPSAGVSVNGKTVTVTFLFAQRTVPYQNPSVRPQAVVVNPVNPPVQNPPTRIGALDLRLKIADRTGGEASSTILVSAIPVWDNCQ